jgi:DNA processing protein
MALLLDVAYESPAEAGAAEPLAALVRLNLTRRLAGAALVRLRARFGSAAAALRAPAQRIQQGAQLGPKAAAAVAASTAGAAELELQRAAREGVRVLGLGHPGYPERLAAVADPPLVLYVRGELPARERLAAVVGSRRSTAYGRRMAGRIAAGLARSGVGVVSGLARGIDGAAHQAALEAGGRTLAVLGCGLGHVYPPQHATLAQHIARQGAVISELPMAEPSRHFHFPRRNRVVSGLSEAVCVVEATERSGSLITARWALEQGRDVLAVPGRVGDANAGGVLRLLEDGAGLALGAESVLRSMGLEAEGGDGGPDAPAGATARTPAERSLLAALGAAERSADALVESTGLGVLEVLSTLTSLEARGAVRRSPLGLYAAV